MFSFRDTVPHVSNAYLSLSKNKELVRNITHLMKDAFPHVPTYATFGNHDYYPSDQVQSHGNSIYNATYELWKIWINDTTQEKYFLKGIIIKFNMSILFRFATKHMFLFTFVYRRSLDIWPDHQSYSANLLKIK